MSLVITKGYLVNFQEYDVFDGIICFINEHGLKFNCFVQGIRKINSKNARNIDFGDLIEFEFFYSQKTLSKLKKAVSLHKLSFESKKKLSLSLINEYFFKYDYQQNFYSFYQQCLTYMEMNINDYLLICFILIKLCEFNGINIKIADECFVCGDFNSQLFFNFHDGSCICKQCLGSIKNFTNDINFLKNLSNSDLVEIINFDINELISLIKNIAFYLYHQSGIFLDTLKVLK